MNDLINPIKDESTMTSLQIAEITGKNHFDVMRAIRKMELAWEKVNGSKFTLVEYRDAKGEKRPCYSLTKTECLYIATKFNDEARAKLVLRWEELEMNRIARAQAQNSTINLLEAQFYIADRLSVSLRLNEASKLGMYKAIAEPYGLSVPDYVPSKGVTKSAKDLLAEIGSPLSSKKFYEILEKHGYLERIERPTTGGKVKRFPSITSKGEPYGENLQSPHNQKETQPHWYVDKFRELYDLVTQEEEE